MIQSKILFSALLMTLLLGICLSSPAATEEELQQAYLVAVQDAEIAEANEIYENLTPIVESNTNLIWTGEAANRRVRVVTWTSWTGYDGMVGKRLQITESLAAKTAAKNPLGSYEASREIWVTVAPEVIEFCTENPLTAQNFELRMEQILGVPPHNGKTRFVEFWVSPSDLFRPSPDPEITDTRAELDFPAGVSEAHQTWFNNLKAASYTVSKYPWTRLGYTYDWGNPNSEVGLTEYVIRVGAVVDVYSVTLNVEYCGISSSVSEWSLY